MRTTKCPRSIKCSESAGSSWWKTTSPRVKRRLRATVRRRSDVLRNVLQELPLHAGRLGRRPGRLQPSRTMRASVAPATVHLSFP